MTYLVYYLVIINIISFIIYGLDKLFAIKHMRRISETTLFTLAIIGGEIGGFIAMVLFHHKTKKISFSVILPLLFVIHFIIYYFYVK
jgi:uncharacterized membrane protein YsdA (DUF1294 family)